MRWNRVADGLWMSLYWDVYREYGEWRLAFLYAHHPLPRAFASAEEAMAYAETIRDG